MSFLSWWKDFFYGGAEFGNELYTEPTPGPESDIREISIKDVTRAPPKSQYSHPQDRRLFLKIKLQNLRDEVVLIRSQEQKLKGHLGLHHDESRSAYYHALIHQMVTHRRWDIRQETRATLLAYGYIRGRQYAQLEQRVKYEYPTWVNKRVERVAAMVNRYSVLDGLKTTPDRMITEIRAWMGVDKSGFRLTPEPDRVATITAVATLLQTGTL